MSEGNPLRRDDCWTCFWVSHPLLELAVPLQRCEEAALRRVETRRRTRLVSCSGCYRVFRRPQLTLAPHCNSLDILRGHSGRRDTSQRAHRAAPERGCRHGRRGCGKSVTFQRERTTSASTSKSLSSTSKIRLIQLTRSSQSVRLPLYTLPSSKIRLCRGHLRTSVNIPSAPL